MCLNTVSPTPGHGLAVPRFAPAGTSGECAGCRQPGEEARLPHGRSVTAHPGKPPRRPQGSPWGALHLGVPQEGA